MKEETSYWFDHAKKDRKAALKLKRDAYLGNIVLFHCQQTIEKILKALLVEISEKVPKIHSVYTLYEKIPEGIKQRLNFKIEELELIDTIYIDTRYPADLGILPSGTPTKQDVKEIIDITAAIYNKISKLLDSSF